MINRPEEQRLLEDVLADTSPPDFRADMLAETLRFAARRRRWRKTRAAGGILAVLSLAAHLAWRPGPEKISAVRSPATVASTVNYRLITTQPWPATAIVTTKESSRVKEFSSEETVTLVATRTGEFRFINDAELLALLGPRPALLVRTGPNSEEIVFAEGLQIR